MEFDIRIIITHYEKGIYSNTIERWYIEMVSKIYWHNPK